MEPNEPLNSETKQKTSRPPAGLVTFALGLILLVIVLKLVCWTVFSQVDVMKEMQKTQNPPQVQILP